MCLSGFRFWAHPLFAIVSHQSLYFLPVMQEPITVGHVSATFPDLFQCLEIPDRRQLMAFCVFQEFPGIFGSHRGVPGGRQSFIQLAVEDGIGETLA